VRATVIWASNMFQSRIYALFSKTEGDWSMDRGECLPCCVPPNSSMRSSS
jgi:hypothetical protein